VPQQSETGNVCYCVHASDSLLALQFAQSFGRVRFNCVIEAMAASSELLSARPFLSAVEITRCPAICQKKYVICLRADISPNCNGLITP